MRAKGYADLDAVVAPWTGEQEWAGIVDAIEKRAGQRAPPYPLEDVAALGTAAPVATVDGEVEEIVVPAVMPPADAVSLLGLEAPPPASQTMGVTV